MRIDHEQLSIFLLLMLCVILHSIQAAPHQLGLHQHHGQDDREDVEVLDERYTTGDAEVLIIQSSMVTPFRPPHSATGQDGEPNFFWSGSGDDPDAGMTYWITQTVTRTSMVTITPSSSSIVTPSVVVVDTVATTSSSVTSPTESSVFASSIQPTPPLPGVVDHPLTIPPPQYWIRTVFRSDADETNPSVRQRIKSRLHQLYNTPDAHLMILGGNGNASRHVDVQVVMQNVSRKDADVHVIYALLMASADGRNSSWGLVEPQRAVQALSMPDDRSGAVGRDLFCNSQDASLCQFVVTRAEPFMSRVETGSSVSTAGSTETYWIVGAVLGALVLLLLSLILIYLITRHKKRRKDSLQTVLQTAQPQVLQKTSSSVGVRSQGTLTIEEDPDPWVRKSRSTSKKHGTGRTTHHHSKKRTEQSGRHHSTEGSSRPRTAPAKRHNSTSSLSGMAYSGSSSAASPTTERLQYRLSREEPVQASRGARRLKKKGKDPSNPKKHQKSSKHTEKVQVNREDLSEFEVPKGGKSQTLVLIGPSVNIDTETQEISADFSGCPDDDDDDEGPRNDNIAIKKASFVGDVASTEVLRWGRPGSLIPSRVTGAVFGSRKISSAPVNGSHRRRRATERQGQINNNNKEEGMDDKDGLDAISSSSRRGWVSSDHLLEAGVISTQETIEHRSWLTEDAPDEVHPRTDQPVPKRHPPLHIHSNSFPAWPSLSDTDPAIDLINTIKAELKKFDQPKKC